MNIYELNCKFIERYLNIPKALRSLSSYPFLIDFNSVGHRINVPIYFKQPQHWLSAYYNNDLSRDELYRLLIDEYNVNLLKNDKFYPIKLFKYYQYRLANEGHGINLIYNNIIKFSRKSNPDTFDGILTDEFNDIIEYEYKSIKPARSVFCVGNEEDYSGLMSWKMLNDIDIENLTNEKPFRVYKDIFGHEVLHTFHPGYWFNVPTNLKEVVYNFIIGGSEK